MTRINAMESINQWLLLSPPSINNDLQCQRHENLALWYSHWRLSPNWKNLLSECLRSRDSVSQKTDLELERVPL